MYIWKLTKPEKKIFNLSFLSPVGNITRMNQYIAFWESQASVSAMGVGDGNKFQSFNFPSSIQFVFRVKKSRLHKRDLYVQRFSFTQPYHQHLCSGWMTGRRIFAGVEIVLYLFGFPYWIFHETMLRLDPACSGCYHHVLSYPVCCYHLGLP